MYEKDQKSLIFWSFSTRLPTKARIAVITANPEPIGDTMDKVPFSKARYNTYKIDDTYTCYSKPCHNGAIINVW